MGIIKDLFTKVSNKDKSCFYTFEKIFGIEPRHYVIRDCTDGFMVLMKKSNIPCDVVEIDKRVETRGNSHIDLRCNSEMMASYLCELMKRKGRY